MPPWVDETRYTCSQAARQHACIHKTQRQMIVAKTYKRERGGRPPVFDIHAVNQQTGEKGLLSNQSIYPMSPILFLDGIQTILVGYGKMSRKVANIL